MSPIDRVAQRAQAFTVLGVSASATRSDIRKAYRRLAFEKHPDQHPECSSEFAEIAEAYRFVCENADELGVEDQPKPVGPRRVSRPTVRAEETDFDETTIAECHALAATEDLPGTLHIASALYRVGRNLTYFVPNAPAKGINTIVVPTGVIHDTRRVLPKAFAVDSRDIVGGFHEMSADDCAEHFPGVRRLQVRFARA